ncbi:MAG: YqgE/AlgH family protein [Myxococcota bacterium]
MKALAPGFLIAMPQLLDPNFQKTVVLMLEHGDGGSMGLVINREANLTFQDLGKSQELEVARRRFGDHLFVGGPVESYRGFVLHDSMAIEEKAEVLPGLFLSVSTDALERLLKDEEATLRFCLGYAGWGPGQVEHELKQGSWLFTEATRARVLTSDPAQIWEEVIKSMGIDPAMLVTTGGVN